MSARNQVPNRCALGTSRRAGIGAHISTGSGFVESTGSSWRGKHMEVGADTGASALRRLGRSRPAVTGACSELGPEASPSKLPKAKVSHNPSPALPGKTFSTVVPQSPREVRAGQKSSDVTGVNCGACTPPTSRRLGNGVSCGDISRCPSGQPVEMGSVVSNPGKRNWAKGSLGTLVSKSAVKLVSGINDVTVADEDGGSKFCCVTTGFAGAWFAP
mmetsp:Transcript_7842/g.21542  ORF Transcript_7842/g.21542 Transcript_7842/m.21542 type:complete len:216 (+) Transcript_7842:994-1641(+)